MTEQPVLYRPHSGAVAAGVCVGIARRYRIDPTVIRVLMVISCFLDGFGLFLYLAGILTIPRDNQKDAPVRRLLPFTRDWPTPAVWLATAAAIMVISGIFTSWRGIAVLPIAIIIFIVYSVNKMHRKASTIMANSPEPTPFERAADTWQMRLNARQQGFHYPTEQGFGYPATSNPYSGAFTASPLQSPTPLPVPPPAPVTPKRRGHGWAIALSLMALGIGSLVLMAEIFWIHVPVFVYAAVVAASLGIGLLASVSRGRPRGMAVLAILACLTTGAMFADTAHSTGLLSEIASEPVPSAVYDDGNITVFENEEDIPAVMNIGIQGSIPTQVFDFSPLELVADTDDHLISIAEGGMLELTVPTNVNTEIDLWIEDFGEYVWHQNGRRSEMESGGPLHKTFQFTPNPDAPTLHLTVHITQGGLLEVIS